MDANQIITLVQSVILGAGGIAGVTAIVLKIMGTATGIAKIRATKQQTKAIEAQTKTVDAQTETVVEAVRNSLVTDIQVDLTAQLEPIVKQLKTEYLTATENTAEQVYAVKSLLVQLCNVMSTSRKLNEDQRSSFKEAIAACDAIVNKPLPEQKNLLIVKCKEKVADVIEKVVDVAKESEVINNAVDAVKTAVSPLTTV